ncbi:hypothetical protein D4764_01G0000490 [Takifugu flavidus]|uniref:Uncharacterized protein n=1 Tax=Takifugu flavidus TaxID=433684 RepID=A0A5C6PKF8_9TELE|nr:hypothetical protein D4764_01G0000490 [Takifugu flavidus]
MFILFSYARILLISYQSSKETLGNAVDLDSAPPIPPPSSYQQPYSRDVLTKWECDLFVSFHFLPLIRIQVAGAASSSGKNSQTALSPATSISSSGGTPSHSQARQEI